MEFRLKSLRLLDVGPGTVAHIHFVGMVSESREEARSMELMRKREAYGEVEYVADDGTTTKHALWPLTYPPFENRFFLSMRREDDNEEFLLFTGEAANVVFGVKLDRSKTKNLSRLMTPPSKLKPVYFRATKGKMNGHPCVTIVTNDSERGIKLACRQDNIVPLVKRGFEGGRIIAMNSPVDDSTEIISIETNTITQAVSALIMYGPYIGIIE